MDTETQAGQPDTNGFEKLNQEFYAANPADYFGERLRLLALRAAKPSAVEAALGKELVWGGIRFVAEDVGAETTNSAVTVTSQFVALETQNLFHHTSEAVLRVFLAHELRGECPWIDMAALNNYRDYRAKRTELAQPSWPNERLKAVEYVFFGSEFPEDADGELVEVRDSIVRLIHLLARRGHDDANLYNSTKHGLTALGGMKSIQITIDDPGGADEELSPSISSVGHTATFLESERDKAAQETKWYRAVRWVQPQKTSGLIEMALVLLESIWSIARWRYVGAEHPGGIEYVDPAAIDRLLQMNEGGPVTNSRLLVATEPF